MPSVTYHCIVDDTVRTDTPLNRTINPIKVKGGEKKHINITSMLHASQTLLRKRSTNLPTTFAQSTVTDGSVKSIKLEAPLAKAIRSADGFIKGTYAWMFLSIFSIYFGSVWIFRSSASIVLNCQADGCTFNINTPYGFVPKKSINGIIQTADKPKRKTTIRIKRDQLVRADNIKWDPESQAIVENYGLGSPTYSSQQPSEDEVEGGEGVGDLGDSRRPTKPWNKHKKWNKKKKMDRNRKKGNKGNYKSYYRTGPDADGNYDSYAVVVRDPLPSSFNGDEESDPDESPSKRMQRQMADRHNSMMNDPNSFASLIAPFAITSNDSMEYIIHLRDFNVGKSHRLPRTSVSKVNAYTTGRRTNFVLREARPVKWQGLVLLIVGIFSLVLCLLLGVFWEEYDPTKVGSYRQRMAETRKRNEAKKLAAQRRNLVKRPQPRNRPDPLGIGRKAY